MPFLPSLKHGLVLGALFTSLVGAIDLPIKENFDSGSLDNWTPIGGGSWTIENQQLKGIGSDGEALILVDTDAADFIFEADLNVTKGVAEGLVGFVFRSSSVNKDVPADYYVFRLWAAGEELKIKKDGTEEVLISMRGSYAGQWSYPVRITALGGDLEVFVDDLETPALKWTDERLQSGAVGFVVSDGGEAYFDNVVVEAQ